MKRYLTRCLTLLLALLMLLSLAACAGNTERVSDPDDEEETASRDKDDREDTEDADTETDAEDERPVEYDDGEGKTYLSNTEDSDPLPLPREPLDARRCTPNWTISPRCSMATTC